MAMGLSSVQLATAVLSFFLLFFVVAHGEKISRREYLEMKRKLETLKKPGVKVIKTTYGAIYDCVDIHKQSSLDHPLLKNHTVQMSPTYLPEVLPNANVSGSGAVSMDVSLPDGGCPEGSVPIQRLTVEQMIRRTKAMRHMERNLLKGSAYNYSVSNDGYQHQFVTLNAKESRYYGFSSTMNTWNPGDVGKFQGTGAVMWLKNGPRGHENVLAAGWMVDPDMYVYNYFGGVYLFLQWTSDGYRDGCYNKACPGFIQISGRIPIPVDLHPLSTYEGTQCEVKLQIYRDGSTGNWWFTYWDEPIGYWPAALLPHMSEYASGVEWGGAAFGIFSSFPPIGSGRFAEEGYKSACYMRSLYMIGRAGGVVDVPTDPNKYTSDPTCYSIVDHLPKGDDFMGRHIYFGGPGGHCKPY